MAMSAGAPPMPTGLRAALWPHPEDLCEEESDHELEHNTLAHWICCQSLCHLAVAVSKVCIELNRNALNDQQERLLRVGKVRRCEDQ